MRLRGAPHGRGERVEAGSACRRAFWLLGIASLACVEPDVRRHHGPAPIEGVAELAIDAGEGVVLDPGEGVGVGVDYLGDGIWEVRTVCDTRLTGAGCVFDLLASSEDLIDTFDGLELEADDALWAPDPLAVQLDLFTEADVDGVVFSTLPGATVRLSALLYDPILDSAFDWSDDPRIISWVGSGAAHWGAPTNPVDLRPNRP